MDHVFGVFDGDNKVTDDYADSIDGAFELACECVLAGADNIVIHYPCVYDHTNTGYVRVRGARSSIINIDASEFSR
jgi:hypothetical protein